MKTLADLVLFAVTVLLCALAIYFLSGCAETRVQLASPGHPASFRTAADASRVHLVLRQSSAVLDIDELNHSAPTDARGRSVAQAGKAAAGVITAAGAAALLP